MNPTMIPCGSASYYRPITSDGLLTPRKVRDGIKRLAELVSVRKDLAEIRIPPPLNKDKNKDDG